MVRRPKLLVQKKIGKLIPNKYASLDALILRVFIYVLGNHLDTGERNFVLACKKAGQKISHLQKFAFHLANKE